MQSNFLIVGINDTGDALTLTTARADPAFNFTPPDLPLVHEEANGREIAERTMGAIVLNLLETLHPDVFARYPALRRPPTTRHACRASLSTHHDQAPQEAFPMQQGGS